MQMFPKLWSHSDQISERHLCISVLIILHISFLSFLFPSVLSVHTDVAFLESSSFASVGVLQHHLQAFHMYYNRYTGFVLGKTFSFFKKKKKEKETWCTRPESELILDISDCGKGWLAFNKSTEIVKCERRGPRF